MTHLEAQAEALRDNPEAEEAEHAAQEQMQQEARERITACRLPEQRQGQGRATGWMMALMMTTVKWKWSTDIDRYGATR